MTVVYENVRALKPVPDFNDKKRIQAGIVDAEGSPLLSSYNRRKSYYVNELSSEQNSLPEAALRVKGKALYGGVIHKHFGHFFLESLSRLYADDGVGDVYFYLQPYSFCSSAYELPGYAKEILNAILGSLDRVKIIKNDVSFEMLSIPEQGFVIRSHILLSLRALYQRLGNNIISSDAHLYHKTYNVYKNRKIWLSRSALSTALIHGEKELEEILLAEDFDIVALEKRKLVEQLAILNAAAGIAGFTGSAFHILLLSNNFSSPIVHFNRWRYVNENFEILLPSNLYNSYFYYDTWRSSDFPKSPMSNTKHDLGKVLERLSDHSLASNNDLRCARLERLTSFHGNSSSKNSIQKLSEKISKGEKDSDVLRDVAEYFFAKGDYMTALRLYEIASVKFPSGGFIAKRLVELRRKIDFNNSMTCGG